MVTFIMICSSTVLCSVIQRRTLCTNWVGVLLVGSFDL